MIANIEQVDPQIHQRREWVFLLLAGIFLGSLSMLNILGVSRFIDLSKYIGIPDDQPIRFILGVGVLAYPITFLCTDFISELYGRRRANNVVLVGLLLNCWIFFILWLGGALNPPEALSTDGLLTVQIKDGQPDVPYAYSFYQIRFYAFGGIVASMFAYMIAQLCDVHIFHFIKKKTKGKKLWLRNNASTLVSQLVDTTAVILITHFYANALPLSESEPLFNQLLVFIASGYLFKVACALFDTIPFYFGTKWLRRYLQVQDEVPSTD